MIFALSVYALIALVCLWDFQSAAWAEEPRWLPYALSAVWPVVALCFAIGLCLSIAEGDKG